MQHEALLAGDQRGQVMSTKWHEQGSSGRREAKGK